MLGIYLNWIWKFKKNTYYMEDERYFKLQE
jgi:hypothetical protein